MTLSPSERIHMRVSARPGSHADRLLDALEAAERERDETATNLVDERDAARAELAACKAKLAALVSAVESDKLPLMMTVREALAAAKETP